MRSSAAFVTSGEPFPGGLQLFLVADVEPAASPEKRRARLHAQAQLRVLRGEESHSGSRAEYASRWRHTGGGALLRLGAHPIGAMLHLKAVEGRARNGTPIAVTHVSAELAAPLAQAPADAATSLADGPRDVESWGCAVLHFADGSRGTAFGSDLALEGMGSHLELRTTQDPPQPARYIVWTRTLEKCDSPVDIM